jgi:hypothetical protein
LINAFYSFSKSLTGTAGDGWQYYNWGLTKGPGLADGEHKFVIQGSYDLPIGKGKRFLNSGGWLNRIIGGWNLLVVATPMSGPPVTFTFAGSPYKYLPGGPARPNQIAPNDQVKAANWSMGSRFPQSAQKAFYNISAFANPAQFTAGTLGVGTQTGRWTVDNQWSISKGWVFERYKFHVRLDGNNIPVRFVSNIPNVIVNLTSPESFGKFPLQTGMNYATMNQANGQLIVSGRFEF